MSLWFAYVYAALLAIGGVMGFVKGGSQTSLAAGVLSALIVCYAAQTERFALGFSVCASLVLAMAYRLALTGKFMPAGMVVLLSALMAVLFFMKM